MYWQINDDTSSWHRNVCAQYQKNLQKIRQSIRGETLLFLKWPHTRSLIAIREKNFAEKLFPSQKINSVKSQEKPAKTNKKSQKWPKTPKKSTFSVASIHRVRANNANRVRANNRTG